MDNKNLHIFKLITANIDLITQVNQHFEETQVLFRGGDIPFKHVKRFYKLAAQHYAQTEKPSLLLLKILGK